MRTGSETHVRAARLDDLLATLGDQAFTVGAAVVTALITTLVVEYAAKPRLEARKARLIRDRQQIDEVIFAFQMAGLHAGAAAAITTDGDEDELRRQARAQHVADLGIALDSIIKAIGRLPVRYVGKHAEHIARASRFIGHAKAAVALAAKGTTVERNYIEQIRDDLGLFDTYFVANVDFRDSQEPFIRRWFWKRFTVRSYQDDAAAAMDDRYGGDPTS